MHLFFSFKPFNISIAVLQKNPESCARFSSPQTIISVLYFSLYAPSLISLSISNPFDSDQYFLIGADILMMILFGIPAKC